jgi:hypothetical protein
MNFRPGMHEGLNDIQRGSTYIKALDAKANGHSHCSFFLFFYDALFFNIELEVTMV